MFIKEKLKLVIQISIRKYLDFFFFISKNMVQLQIKLKLVKKLVFELVSLILLLI